MKDLKFLLITNNFNELAVSFCSHLNEIGTTKILVAYENTKIINAIIRSDIDVVFLDVNYLGSDEASRIYNLIENIIGKVCIYVENKDTQNTETTILFSKYGNIDYEIVKIDLFLLIIEALNLFNNNTLLRKEKCYDFIYIVCEDIEFKRIDIKFIREIFKEEKAIYMFCKNEYTAKRIINISFEMLYKLLNKNFEKSRFKITNKNWLPVNAQNDLFFMRNSA